MSSDYDKAQWQAEQEARDIALEKQRDKDRKTRERSARNAQRKLERLYNKLKETGDITDFENEFGESVLERLDKFGSAFHDLEKGRPGDALSFAQKSVVAAMNKKVKALKAKAVSDAEDDFDDGYERTADQWKNRNSNNKKRSSFSSRGKAKFQPRVRHIEEDMIEAEMKVQESAYETLAPDIKDRVPYLPQYIADKNKPQLNEPRSAEPKPAPKKPFLRLIK